MSSSGVFYPIGIYKYVTLDAFTGSLLSMYSYSDSNEKSALKADKLSKTPGLF
jgi:hypothetical protein